jgi:hypothetical protein
MPLENGAQRLVVAGFPPTRWAGCVPGCCFRSVATFEDASVNPLVAYTLHFQPYAELYRQTRSNRQVCQTP